MSADPSLACGVLNKLGKSWLDMCFTDLVVTVDQIPFHCHKFHLCACSAFFDTLLNTENADGSKNNINHVIITGISSTTFENVLRTIYKGENVLDENNMILLWYAAQQLQVDLLVTKCEDFVSSHLTVDNYENTYLNAVCLESSPVLDSVLKFMADNFEHFRQTPTFLDLPYDHLKILVDKFPKIPKSYDSLISSIVLWVSHVTADDDGNIGQKSEVHANVSSKYNEGKLNINTAETRASAAENVSAETDAEVTFMVPPLSITEESSRQELRGILRSYSNQYRHQCLGNLLETAHLERASTDYLKSLTNDEWLMGIKGARDVVWNAVVEQKCVQANPAARRVNTSSSASHPSGYLVYKPLAQSEGPYAYRPDTDRLYQTIIPRIPGKPAGLRLLSCSPMPLLLLFVTQTDHRNYGRDVERSFLYLQSQWNWKYAVPLKDGCCAVYYGDFFYCLKKDLIYRTRALDDRIYFASNIGSPPDWSNIGKIDYCEYPVFSVLLNGNMYVFASTPTSLYRTHLYCFDLTKHRTVHCKATINGTSVTQGLLTFTYSDKLFILQATGELYRLDHTTYAHFSVSPFYKQCDDGEAYDEGKKLWNCKCWGNMLGVMVYNNELVVFVKTNSPIPEPNCVPLGLENIRFVEILSDDKCYVTYEDLNLREV